MRNLSTLEGIEGDRRLKRALFDAVESAKQSRAQVARMATARTMADEMLEKEQVEKIASAFAANRRHNIG